jgi:hypothetical protein
MDRRNRARSPTPPVRVGTGQHEHSPRTRCGRVDRSHPDDDALDFGASEQVGGPGCPSRLERQGTGAVLLPNRRAAQLGQRPPLMAHARREPCCDATPRCRPGRIDQRTALRGQPRRRHHRRPCHTVKPPSRAAGTPSARVRFDGRGRSHQSICPPAPRAPSVRPLPATHRRDVINSRSQANAERRTADDHPATSATFPAGVRSIELPRYTSSPATRGRMRGLPRPDHYPFRGTSVRHIYLYRGDRPECRECYLCSGGRAATVRNLRTALSSRRWRMMSRSGTLRIQAVPYFGSALTLGAILWRASATARSTIRLDSRDHNDSPAANE